MRLPSLVLGAVALTGCTVGPDYQPPAPVIPEVYGATTQPVAEAPVELRQWWTTFDDPILDSLIERATAENLSLRLAAARVREATCRLRRDLRDGRAHTVAGSLASARRRVAPTRSRMPLPSTSSMKRQYQCMKLTRLK
jgi:outer membrane protein TolC